MSNTQNFVYINENLLNQEEALISVDERGFLFGDGLFETCRFIDKKIINFDAHLNRIKIGLSVLKFNTEIKNLDKKCYNLIKKNNLNDGIIRISISRGVGSVGYLPTNKSPNLTIIQTKNLPKIPQNIYLIESDFKPSQFSFKSANSLNYVLAKIYANENSCFDAILCDDKGYICETSSANIFWIKDGIIYTPSDECQMVRGTVRETLLKTKDFQIKQGKFKISTLKKADEVFITNASFLILPITKIVFKNKKSSNKSLEERGEISVNYQQILVKEITQILTKKYLK